MMRIPAIVLYAYFYGGMVLLPSSIIMLKISSLFTIVYLFSWLFFSIFIPTVLLDLCDDGKLILYKRNGE